MLSDEVRIEWVNRNKGRADRNLIEHGQLLVPCVCRQLRVQHANDHCLYGPELFQPLGRHVKLNVVVHSNDHIYLYVIVPEDIGLLQFYNRYPIEDINRWIKGYSGTATLTPH